MKLLYRIMTSVFAGVGICLIFAGPLVNADNIDYAHYQQGQYIGYAGLALVIIAIVMLINRHKIK